jgi:hypothetical protein
MSSNDFTPELILASKIAFNTSYGVYGLTFVLLTIALIYVVVGAKCLIEKRTFI